MKKKILDVVLAFVISAAVFSANAEVKSQYKFSDAFYQKTLKVFQSSLESDIPGIVESTIYNVVVLKKYYPSADYNKIVNELNDIAVDNASPAIRYKAHLASMYLTLNGIVVVHPIRNTYEHEYIFKQISEQLENKLLTSN